VQLDLGQQMVHEASAPGAVAGSHGEITVRAYSRAERNVQVQAGRLFAQESVSVFSTETKADWGMSTDPIVFMRFLPSFCFSSSLRLRVMSPP